MRERVEGSYPLRIAFPFQLSIAGQSRVNRGSIAGHEVIGRCIEQRRWAEFDAQLFQRLEELVVLDCAELLCGQVSEQVGSYVLGAGRLRNFQIGGHSFALDQVSIGRKPIGHAQENGRAVAEPKLVEDGTRTEGCLPDQDGALVFLKGAGGNLAGTGSAYTLMRTTSGNSLA